MASENKYPTLADAARVLANLVDGGFGELPFQVIIAPDSTIQILAHRAADEKPALMMEYKTMAGRPPVCILSVDRLSAPPGRAMPTIKLQ